MIQLPVVPIVAQSLLLPFEYLPKLVKFGAIPFLLILVVDAFCFVLQREDVSRLATGNLMALAHFILFTPFSVAWTKLAIKGRGAVANHPQFAYSRTQFHVGDWPKCPLAQEEDSLQPDIGKKGASRT